MNGLSAACPQCGKQFHGWALVNQRHQWCRKCGCGLEIYRDGLFMGMGYSPLTAPHYRLSFHQSNRLVADRRVKSDELFECKEILRSESLKADSRG